MDNFIKHVKKLLYDIRGEEEVEKLLNAPWREDVRAAFNALYDERDPQKAMRLYEKAAQAGSVEAMYELGQLLFSCHGDFWLVLRNRRLRIKDINEAIRCYKKAASFGSAKAARTLAHIYQEGVRVPKDTTEAQRRREMKNFDGGSSDEFFF